MGLDILPESRDDDRPGLSMNSEQPGQPLIQLELQRLVVEQEEDSALDVAVAGSLHLEAVRLLRGRRAVPLHQVVVRPVQVLVQLDDQGLEERGELSLALAGVNLLLLINDAALDAQLPGGDARLA